MEPDTAADYEQLPIQSDGQQWIVSWCPPDDVPSGRNHGSLGICMPDEDTVVLISLDGIAWDLPAGRRESDETWEQTLRREMREEACAEVTQAQLLGFCRSQCESGPEQGLVLVRSLWLARVRLDEWLPAHEVAHRKTVPVEDLLSHLPSRFGPIFRRALQEAAVL